MAAQAELAFVEKLAGWLSESPVQFSDDFQQSLENMKKVPVLQVDLPPPPERKIGQSSTSGSINVTFKSLKPAHSYTLSVQLADTIASIKSQLASEPGAPPADVQRLLIKGKALADAKLLKEYEVKDGDTLNLVVKAGYTWDPSKIASPSTEAERSTDEPVGIVLIPAPTKQKPGHARIPSVVLSPSPSLTPTTDLKLVDIPLVLDTSNIPSNADPCAESTYHTTISKPEFWEHLYVFLSSEFVAANDAEAAWENFFLASKGSLSPSQIAKIRENVGVSGMAGT